MIVQAQEMRTRKRDDVWLQRQRTQLDGVPSPAGRPRHLIFTAFTRFGLGGKGKVYIPEYFPGFTQQLAEMGVDCSFVFDEQALAEVIDDRDTAILHIFNEEKLYPTNGLIRAAEKSAGVVFCTHRAALIACIKPRTNRFLTARGISMPAIIDPEDGSDLGAPVFSNAAIGSGRRTRVLANGADLDLGRYNTRYIDTRLTFEDKTYHTMFRIQAVGRQVQHAYPRARDVSERSASVHSKDTPANGPLIEFLFRTLIEPRREEIARHTFALGEILGPGFYAHDMVVCNSTGRMYMVETGFKFNDTPYATYLEPDAGRMPSNRIFYTGEYPVRAATLFLGEWEHARRHGQPDPTGTDLWTDAAFQ